MVRSRESSSDVWIPFPVEEAVCEGSHHISHINQDFLSVSNTPSLFSDLLNFMIFISGAILFSHLHLSHYANDVIIP